MSVYWLVQCIVGEFAFQGVVRVIISSLKHSSHTLEKNSHPLDNCNINLDDCFFFVLTVAGTRKTPPKYADAKLSLGSDIISV
jgi:hypothetical protein